MIYAAIGWQISGVGNSSFGLLGIELLIAPP